MCDSVVRVHKGEERLVVAFWLYAFLFGSVLGALAEFISLAGANAGVVFLGSTLEFLTTAIAVLYFLWSMLIVWRCAYNVRRRYWGHAARAIAVAMPLVYLAEILLG